VHWFEVHWFEVHWFGVKALDEEPKLARLEAEADAKMR
jgi:hypothetical protein